MILLGTQDGLHVLSDDGSALDVLLPGEVVVSVDSRDATRVVAVEGKGVQRSAGGGVFEVIGLTEKTLWRVRTADGVIFAGVEPAAILRYEGDQWTDLAGLALVDGHEEWESPWGEADLCSILIEPARLIVGVEVGGVAISTDGGETWAARNNGLFEDVHTVLADGDDLYATTGGGLHRSRDGGREWTWEADGIDRGYTQGLALSGGNVIVAASSGPPPMWESGGPQGAIFRSPTSGKLSFETITEDFEGNIERQAMDSSGDLVVAGTTAGEVLISRDAGASFEKILTGLPQINSLVIEG